MAKSVSLLWGAGSPPCWRVTITLQEKKLQGCKRKLLSFETGEHKSQEVLEINPRGQLPAFKHGDNILNESTAACLYLEFKSQGNKLIPDCPAEHALMYQRMMEGLPLADKLRLRLLKQTMAKDMTLLWGSGSPPCWRVMIALEEKNLQGYNQKLLSFEKMEHKSQEVLDINPRGQLPSLKHGDVIVNESYAACFYLESQFKSEGNKLIPDSPAEQALMYQRMFEGLTFYEKLTAVLYYDWLVPEGERHDSAVKRNREALATELKLWEDYLQKLGSDSHLAGPSFSLADVTVFPTVAFLFRFGLSAEHYPKLGEYYALLKERPSIKASWPPHWLENPKGQDTLQDI